MGRRAILIGMICAAPQLANAEALPIEGSYGNPSGCKLAASDEYNPDDQALLLTATELSTSVSLCRFTRVAPATDGTHRVDMTCGFEGSGPEESADEVAEISGNRESGYTVRFSDGASWGPLTRC